ncbi:MAG: hypothetical protein AAF564_06800 [Bacteroidota bacterium]
MYTEIHSLEELRAHIAEHACLDCVVCQDLDLREDSELLLKYAATGGAFLGCEFEDRALTHIIKTGGLVFPKLPNLPYRPYRASLYSISELMTGYKRGDQESYNKLAVDSTIYNHFEQFKKTDEPLPLLEALSQRLHDLAIDDALYDLLKHHPKVVAIMGGHRMKRNEASYRDVALIARGLTRAGYFVATGGGPGAMEAGNLGAWMAKRRLDELDDAIATLSKETDFHTIAYLDLGFEVLEKYSNGEESLAIPTWFYGHEPTNQFSTHIAKYFANSIREDILLAVATSGVIFSPGSAGTIQEVFMDAAQNHYGSFKVVSPMVFFGEQFWTKENPVYPLLQQLAESRQYGEMLSISDSPDEIVAFIKTHAPVPYKQG